MVQLRSQVKRKTEVFELPSRTRNSRKPASKSKPSSTGRSQRSAQNIRPISKLTSKDTKSQKKISVQRKSIPKTPTPVPEEISERVARLRQDKSGGTLNRRSGRKTSDSTPVHRSNEETKNTNATDQIVDKLKKLVEVMIDYPIVTVNSTLGRLRAFF